MQVEELTYNMVFDWSKKAFSGFNKSLENSIKGFAKLTGSVAVAQGVSFAFAKSIANQNDQLAKLSHHLNLSSENYEKLSYGAKNFGAEAGDVTSALRSLRKSQQDVLLGKGDLQAFGELGINPSNFKDTNSLFLAVSDSLSKIGSQSKKLNLMDRIGISENLLQMMEQGSTSIKAMGKELEALGGIKTKEQLQVANDFQGIFLKTTKIVEGLSSLVGTELLKKYNKALKTINKFFIEHAKQITQAFGKFFDLLNNISQKIVFVFDRVINLIVDISSLMGGFEKAVLAVGIAFAILKRRMIMAFALPLIVGVALFAVIEDIVGFLQGRDSVIGNFFNVDGTKTLSSIKSFFAVLTNEYDIFINHTKDKGLVDTLIEGFKRFDSVMERYFFAPFANGIDMLIKKIKELIKSFDISNAINTLASGLKSIGIGAVEGVKEYANPNHGGFSSPTNNANTANVTINVNGADGDSVLDQVEEYFRVHMTSIFGAN